MFSFVSVPKIISAPLDHEQRQITSSVWILNGGEMKSSEEDEEEEEAEGLEESLNTSSRGISFPVEGDVMFRRGGVKPAIIEETERWGLVS